jgi:hypothetical protein
MQIYKIEIMDGVSELVQRDTSIAYCSQAVLTQELPSLSSIITKLQASSNRNQIDLHYIKSVLVSTGWNKNDDVFAPEQTWAARNTPEDKQFNFMHNENDIIGHITGSYVIDRNGTKLEADSKEVPQQFDIITEAVLYNSWSNPENRERMQKIISEIEEGKWFVSMECLFSGFDYAVVEPNGNNKVIARNEDSAFLTKHLRAYGGTGEYEGYKIGRSLRDISFSGKGLVSRPANPRSIILDSSKAFSINEQNDSNVKGDFQMQDNNEQKQLPVDTELASSTEQVVVVQTEAQTEEVAADNSAFEATIAQKDEAIKTLEAAVLSLQEALAAKEAELTGTLAEVMDMKKKEKNRTRKGQLVSAGFEEAEAEESLSLYDNLEDTAFEAIVAMFKKKAAKPKSKFTEDISKDEPNESTNPKAEVVSVEATVAEEATEKLFDGVTSTEAALVDASNDKDELAVTRASVAEWLTENVLRK